METPGSASAGTAGCATSTELTSITQWTTRFADGVLPVSGGLFRVAMTVEDLFGPGLSTHDTETLLGTIAARMRQVVGPHVELMHDADLTIYGWMPAADGAAVRQLLAQLTQTLSTTPICLPGGYHVMPTLLLQGQAMAAGLPVADALQALQRVGDDPAAVFTLVPTDHPFDVDPTVERAVRALHLPERMPVTVLLAGQPNAGHDAIATRLRKLAHGQWLSTVDVDCAPADADTPFAKIVALARGLAMQAPAFLKLPVVIEHAWLRDALVQSSSLPAWPSDDAVTRDAFIALLRAMAGTPVVAVLRHIEHADAASLAVLSAMQGTPDHGLRLIATLEVDTTAALSVPVQQFVAHCRILTPEPPHHGVPTTGARTTANAEMARVKAREQFPAKVLPKALEVVLAIRRAGSQMRLYPLDNPLVRRQLTEAHEALSSFLLVHDRLPLAVGDDQFFCGGHPITRPDQRAQIKEIENWMRAGAIYALTFSLGVTEEALAGLLHEFITYDANRASVSLTLVLREQALPGITVIDASADAETALFALDDETVIDAPLRIAALTAEGWRTFPRVWAAASPGARRAMLADMQGWMTASPMAVRAVADDLDQLFCHIIHDERSTIVVPEVARTVAVRLTMLINADDDARSLLLMDAIRQRQEMSDNDMARHAYESVLAHAGAQIAARVEAFARMVESPEEIMAMRQLTGTLGEHFIRPLITALKEARVMQERARLIRLLRDVAGAQQELLLAELRDTENPWYVYRNMLQILGDIGTEAGLSAIRAKIAHADPRVRAEAVAAATRIARLQATPYLAQGLDDTDAGVRLRAASLAALCPQASILDRLLTALQAQFGTEPPAEYQIAATLSLGSFPQDEARIALLQMLYPPLIAQYPTKPDEVRAAAVTALSHHRGLPGVEKALAQACNDRSLLVRQAAQRLSE